MSRRDLAEASGVSYGNIILLETGANRDPKLSTIRLLAHALGLDACELAQLLAPAATAA